MLYSGRYRTVSTLLVTDRGGGAVEEEAGIDMRADVLLPGVIIN